MTTQNWDIAAFHGASATDDRLSFYNSRTGSQFSLNGNAAFLINNNAGTTGQVLQSNGTSSPASWASSTNTLYNGTGMVSASATYTSNNGTPTLIPGLTGNFFAAGTAKVMVSFNLQVASNPCAFCGNQKPLLNFISMVRV